MLPGHRVRPQASAGRAQGAWPCGAVTRACRGLEGEPARSSAGAWPQGLCRLAAVSEQGQASAGRQARSQSHFRACTPNTPVHGFRPIRMHPPGPASEAHECGRSRRQAGAAQGSLSRGWVRCAPAGNRPGRKWTHAVGFIPRAAGFGHDSCREVTARGPRPACPPARFARICPRTRVAGRSVGRYNDTDRPVNTLRSQGGPHAFSCVLDLAAY